MNRWAIARELIRIARKLVYGTEDRTAKRMSESYWKKYKKEHPKADPRNHEIVPDRPKKNKPSLSKIVKDLGNHCEAVEKANAKYGNVYEKCRETEHLIERFSQNGYKQGSGKRLTQAVCHAFNVKPDGYRAKQLLPMSPKTVNEFKKYVAHQQDVLRNSPFAVEGDCIILFRNTTNQIKKVNGKYDYDGNNIESWTTNPDLSWKGTKIMAKIPISTCIASYIGRNETNHSFMNQKQCEVMICGSFVKNIQIVGENGSCDEKIKKLYEMNLKERINP